MIDFGSGLHKKMIISGAASSKDSPDKSGLCPRAKSFSFFFGFESRVKSRPRNPCKIWRLLKFPLRNVCSAYFYSFISILLFYKPRRKYKAPGRLIVAGGICLSLRLFIFPELQLRKTHGRNKHQAPDPAGIG
jgi:hypothetical protein